jgi:hypothetical protein
MDKRTQEEIKCALSLLEVVHGILDRVADDEFAAARTAGENKEEKKKAKGQLCSEGEMNDMIDQAFPVRLPQAPLSDFDKKRCRENFAALEELCSKLQMDIIEPLQKLSIPSSQTQQDSHAA